MKIKFELLLITYSSSISTYSAFLLPYQTLVRLHLDYINNTGVRTRTILLLLFFRVKILYSFIKYCVIPIISLHSITIIFGNHHIQSQVIKLVLLLSEIDYSIAQINNPVLL